MLSSRVKLSVNVWALGGDCASEFRYSCQLRRSLHDFARIFTSVRRLVSPAKNQEAWEGTLAAHSCFLQRRLLHSQTRGQRVVLTPPAIKEVHHLLWMLLLSGITEMPQKQLPQTEQAVDDTDDETSHTPALTYGAEDDAAAEVADDAAERALLTDMMMQLVQYVLKRVIQQSHALLLHVCDDVCGEGILPVDVVDLIYSFVGNGRDNGLFAATASELMGSRFLSELVSRTLCRLQQLRIDTYETHRFQRMPTQFDFDFECLIDALSQQFCVVQLGTEPPHESLQLQIEHDSDQSDVAT
ncbi:MAG: hypothetical protein MHM6MM_008360 [Cercozoa sp. M6MM]